MSEHGCLSCKMEPVVCTLVLPVRSIRSFLGAEKAMPSCIPTTSKCHMTAVAAFTSAADVCGSFLACQNQYFYIATSCHAHHAPFAYSSLHSFRLPACSFPGWSIVILASLLSTSERLIPTYTFQWPHSDGWGYCKLLPLFLLVGPSLFLDPKWS